MRFEPNEPGKGFEFENRVREGHIPREYIPPVERGVKAATEVGDLAGFPVVDVKAILLDGKYHEVDSSEFAFEIAGSLAFKEAMKAAGMELAGTHDEPGSDHARAVFRRSAPRC